MGAAGGALSSYCSPTSALGQLPPTAETPGLVLVPARDLARTLQSRAAFGDLCQPSPRVLKSTAGSDALSHGEERRRPGMRLGLASQLCAQARASASGSLRPHPTGAVSGARDSSVLCCGLCFHVAAETRHPRVSALPITGRGGQGRGQRILHPPRLVSSAPCTKVQSVLTE